MAVLTINCGSSSLRYRLFGEGLAPAAGGVVERIGQAGTAMDHRAPGRAPFAGAVPVADHGEALALALETLRDPDLTGDLAGVAIAGVGHRVVHGGELFRRSVAIDHEVLLAIDALAALAPLHNPVNAQGIRAARALLPDALHAAIFDTAFHHTIPPAAHRYAVPEAWVREHGVRRYGFHGTSFRYVTRRAAVLLGRPPEEVDLILLHVGNGASACAVAGGRSVDTTMGLTPLEGLVMGTRCGDLDPAVPFHLMRVAGLEPEEIERALQRDSGMLGMAGVMDRREVVAAAEGGDARARLALEVECHRLRKVIGAYLAVLGGADAVVFTGGVGENSPAVRAGALQGLERLGIALDPARNRAATGGVTAPITAADSPLPVLVIPTDEERVMAEDVVALLGGDAAGRGGASEGEVSGGPGHPSGE